MATASDDAQRRGFVSRLWRRLSTPSARWSVLALVIIGLVIGAGGTIATQVMVAATGTNEFCGGACHSMQWVAQEYRQSGHAVNRTGVSAGCHDCHIPHAYPQLLWYKAKAGLHDAIAEMRGVISTEEKFKKERLRQANHHLLSGGILGHRQPVEDHPVRRRGGATSSEREHHAARRGGRHSKHHRQDRAQVEKRSSVGRIGRLRLSVTTPA